MTGRSDPGRPARTMLRHWLIVVSLGLICSIGLTVWAFQVAQNGATRLSAEQGARIDAARASCAQASGVTVVDINLNWLQYQANLAKARALKHRRDDHTIVSALIATGRAERDAALAKASRVQVSDAPRVRYAVLRARVRADGFSCARAYPQHAAH